MAYFLKNGKYPESPQFLKQVHDQILDDRRKYLCCCFIFNILQDIYHTPSILENLKFNVPSKSLRKANFSHTKFHRTNYGMYEQINHMSILFNEIAHLFDFNCTDTQFKTLLKKIYLSSK